MQHKCSLLIPCLMFCLLAGWFAVDSPGSAANSAASGATNETITIDFPVQSLGRLDFAEIDSRTRKVTLVGHARAEGKVVIPAHCKINLVLSYYGGQNTNLLAKIPGDLLHRLDCNTVEMDDKNLSQIGQLKKLEQLDVQKTNLTDDDFRQFAGLRNLRELTVNDTLLTPVGLAVINNFKKLEILKISSTKVGGLSTINFSGLTCLKVLDACKTNLVSKDLQKIEGLRAIESLNLGKNDIDDSGIDSILKLKTLLYLDLVDNKVTVKGLCRLAKLPKLRKVFLRRSRYKPAELLEVQKQIPQARIENDFREKRMDKDLFAPLK